MVAFLEFVSLRIYVASFGVLVILAAAAAMRPAGRDDAPENHAPGGPALGLLYFAPSTLVGMLSLMGPAALATARPVAMTAMEAARIIIEM